MEDIFGEGAVRHRASLCQSRYIGLSSGINCTVCDRRHDKETKSCLREQITTSALASIFKAAQSYAHCSATFEEVALKFLDAGERTLCVHILSQGWNAREDGEFHNRNNFQF